MVYPVVKVKIKTLIVGNLNNSNVKGNSFTDGRKTFYLSRDWAHGFTLIEIVVVLALISILMAFAVPRFRDVFQFDPTKKPSRWIIVKVPDLRYRALRNQRTYTLHIGLSENSLWTTHAAMSAEEIEQAESTKVYRLTGGIRLTGVVLSNGKRQTADVVDIHFYPQGWADPAIIHMETDRQKRLSFIIEPFLSAPVRVNGYKELEGR